MSQPVKLSDDLVLDARLTGEANQRSIAGQVEHWARLGRAIEGVMRTRTVRALKRVNEVRSVSESLEEVGTQAGRARLEAVLADRPFPHFKAAEGRPGMLVKIDVDGPRTVGRFVNRVFTPAETR